MSLFVMIDELRKMKAQNGHLFDQLKCHNQDYLLFH